METKKVGEDLTTKAKALKIKKVVFDRSVKKNLKNKIQEIKIKRIKSK